MNTDATLVPTQSNLLVPYIVFPTCNVITEKYSDHFTAVGLQNVFGNVNMLTNRYRICPLMCITMGDPTCAFVLAAT